MGRSIPPPPSLWLFPFSLMGCTWAVLSSLRRFYGDSIELYGPLYPTPRPSLWWLHRALWAALFRLRRLHGCSHSPLWAAPGPLYPPSTVSMVTPLSSMCRVWAALSPPRPSLWWLHGALWAALSPLLRLYGCSHSPLWAARGPLYPPSTVSMVTPLSSMCRVWAALSPPRPSLWWLHGALWAALSPLRRLYGCSHFPLWAAREALCPFSAVSMVAPLSSVGRSIRPHPSLW